MSNDTAAPPTVDTVRWGRRSHTFVPTPEWILLAGLTPQALALYTLLLAHVNRQRGDGVAWPGMDTLAQLMGYRRRQSVAKYIRELAEIDAITVEIERTLTGRRNVYTVNEVAPTGYTRPVSLADFYARKRAAQRGWVATAHDGLSATANEGSCATTDENQTYGTTGSHSERSTSSVAACAASRSKPKPRTPTRRVYYPRDFAYVEDKGEVLHYMLKAGIAAINRAGLALHPDARSWMSETLSYDYDEMDRADLMATLKEWVTGAGDPWSEHGWLAHPAARKRAA